MSLSLNVGSQAYTFLCSVGGGLIIGFIYDLFRIKRKAVKTHNITVYFEDLLYWIIVSVVLFGVFYYSNDGEIRGYLFLGTLIGVILYALLLSTIIVKSSMQIIRIISKIIKTLWFVLTYPVRLLQKILAIPARFALRILRKSARSVKRAGRSKASNIKAGMRRLKNIRKKI